MFKKKFSKPNKIRWNRTGFKPYKKSCIAPYYTQFFTNIKIKIIKLIPVLLAQDFVPFG